MKRLYCVILAVIGVLTPSLAGAVLFDFDSAPAHSPLPIDITVSGVTAHFSATGQGFSIQQADVLGFTPLGFSGNCIYPSSVFAADLLVSFDQTLTGFSILYAPEEYACDTSALLRVTAYMDGAYIGTATMTADPPGTWPSATLSITAPQGFNSVVVHYDSPPPTGGDWGPIFMADNMDVTPVDPASTRTQPSPLAAAPSVSPNPFAGETAVRFDLARMGPVSAMIFDAQGRVVRTLAAGAVFSPGARVLRWDGTDDHGRAVASGIYLCRVRSGAHAMEARMVLLRTT